MYIDLRKKGWNCKQTPVLQSKNLAVAVAKYNDHDTRFVFDVVFNVLEKSP